MIINTLDTSITTIVTITTSIITITTSIINVMTELHHPQNPYVKALIPIVTMFVDRASREVSKAKGGHEGGKLIRQDCCSQEKRKKQQKPLPLSSQDTEETPVTRGLSVSQEGRPPRNRVCQHLDLGHVASGL